MRFFAGPAPLGAADAPGAVADLGHLDAGPAELAVTHQTLIAPGPGVMNAIAGPRPASFFRVAMRRPGCTASRDSPSRSPRAAAVRSSSSTRNEMPHRRAGPLGSEA